MRRLTTRQWFGYLGFALVFLLTAAVAIWRGDILRAGLDPQVPFQTYDPPPAPNYADPNAWALLDARVDGAGTAAVFFVHSTTFDGGSEWNSPIGEARADAYLARVVLPNYAGPFARAGSVSAPHYRQASLYTRLTLRDDAREARAFAYQDIRSAFDVWLARHPTGPIILAGVEQGADLLDRLIRQRVAPDAALRDRLAAAYLMDTIIAADNLAADVPACARREQLHCIVAWSQVGDNDEGPARRRLRRALVWDDRGRLVELEGRSPVCVNPVIGSTAEDVVPARAHRGATNATGLEWGARPALVAREVETQCRDGILRHSWPDLESIRKGGGSWADRRKARPYNLFYGDLEADVASRLSAYAARTG
jgi:hypothetical protein